MVGEELVFQCLFIQIEFLDVLQAPEIVAEDVLLQVGQDEEVFGFLVFFAHQCHIVLDVLEPVLSFQLEHPSIVVVGVPMQLFLQQMAEAVFNGLLALKHVLAQHAFHFNEVHWLLMQVSHKLAH